jgi:prevent-host-death family protein
MAMVADPVELTGIAIWDSEAAGRLVERARRGEDVALTANGRPILALVGWRRYRRLRAVGDTNILVLLLQGFFFTSGVIGWAAWLARWFVGG